jgi:diadenosine tetraphosphatase ApaH/serine/threonine PP2A family protein phosphatase
MVASRAIRDHVQPMRIAVVSDIHANLHALSAVQEAIQDDAPDLVWCLGDLVGYGARPNECTSSTRELADLCLAGNHDLGVLDEVPLEDFSDEAAASALWTREVLEDDQRGYLAELGPQASVDEPEVELFHASPRDPVWEYILDVGAAEAAFELTSSPLVLVGHSHVPLVARLEDEVTASHAPEGTEIDLSRGRVLLNPGSIGQPRDGDWRAAYLVLDFDAGTATFRRVEYAVEQTQQEIIEAGLPESLAERLGHGL